MIQARKDVSASSKEQRPEEQTLQSIPQRIVRTVPSDQRHEIIIANSSDTPTIILSEGSSLGEGSTLQHRLSLGTPLQHVLTPTQVSATSTAITETQIPISSRCAVTSTQDVCGILVSTTTTSSLHPVELQNTVVNVSTTTVPHLQTIGNITSVPVSAPRIERAAGFTQNLGPKLVYHRIPSSNITGSGLQRVMLVDSSGSFGSSNEVAKVHSYSLASAPISSLSSNTAPGQTLQAPSIQHKAIIATSHNQLRTAVKRTLSTSNSNRTETVSSVNCVNDIVSRLSVMNKLLSGLTISEGKITNIPSSPKSKRIKLEKITNKDVLIKRKKLTDYFAKKLKHLQMKYYNQQVEYFFLKTGCNMVDYVSFRKKLSTDVLEYLRENRFDSHDEITSIVELLSRWPSSLSSGASSFMPGLSNDHSQTSKPITSNVSSHNQSVSRVLFSPSSSIKLIDSSHLASQTTVTKSVKLPVTTHKQSSKHNSISTVYDSQIGSQEEIVERAKQEAYVMQRVGDLRKEGLWSFKRLPKVAESPRIKAHWDYLLEEMVWLATDFAQERKWKKAAAKKCARMITKYFQEKEIKAEKAEKEEQLKMRKIASIMAREIKQFWSNIEKLVEYKQQTWLDEKRKKVLDVHLNFIVDQTEKYSSWLTQGMNRTFKDSPSSSRASSPCPDSPLSIPQKTQHDISDFEPDSSASDDEETIKKEEEDIDVEEQSREIALLQQESEMSLEEFLDTLPQEVLESHSQLNDEDKFSMSNETNQGAFSEDEKIVHKNSLDDDADFEFSEDEEDDEQTILEQEKVEKYVDHEEEIKELEAENELSVDELREKYSGAYASDFKIEGSEKNDEDSLVPSENESDISVDVSSEEEDIETGQKDQLAKSFNEEDDGKSSPSKEISDIAATAESFQPKGNTLSTTQVFTKVPFLLKHQLREYQHIGLDWLNAMYDKKLNGILADEMGLGKTIQTISVLAHLACDKGIWGPHLIVVPTSVMLNWEMEFKKWCPAFKILTYYGTPKERKQKRVGWTKPNAFHVCITSYKLVVQDHQSFRRKKWKYLILDEAQHIKNFKSQRWQMLLNFQSTHRLLLTGTPLQNNLMELWSLMHFLMPNVFQSHREFREWFVNPVTGMIEGSHEYNESLIKRLHKVLRPFLLRRLKSEVEKQLPKKYEHIIICRLSKRQRYLYDDFMSQTKTKETLATGNFMSVINILMQLRKVCNHPNMFEERPTVSPFQMPGILFYTSSLAYTALEYNAFKHVSLQFLNLLLADLELSLTAFAAHRVKKFQTPSKLILEIDNLPEPPPPCPAVKMRVNFCNSQNSGRSSPVAAQTRTVAARLPASAPNRVTAPATLPPRFMVLPGQQTTPVTRTITPATAITNHPVISQPEQYTLQLVQPGTVASLAPLGGLTLQLQPASPGGNRVQCIQSLIGGLGRMVTTTTGAQWLITTSVANSVSEQPQLQTTISTVSAQPSLPITTTASTTPIVLSTNIATATVIPQVQKIGNPSVSAPFITTFNRPPSSSPSSTSITSQTNHNKPVGRVAPLNVHPPSNPNSSMSNVNHIQPSKGPVVHSLTKPVIKAETAVQMQSEKKHSLFYLDSLVQQREQDRKNSLKSLARINNFRCAACPIYGADLVEAVTSINTLSKNNTNQSFRGEGSVCCNNAKLSAQKPELYWDYTNSLSNLISSPEERILELIEIIKRFVFVIAYVAAPPIQLHISHPPPSNLNAEKDANKELRNFLSPKCAFLHPVISNMKTQFPELRLIQYDCGKLQRLALLLQELKSNQHRVLIFTQMTRMLDILEQFLNYHGHTYLRLDGLTKVEQRQALMERFNADKRIFCFILSTRSGGIGVNLTGADTVIFYDSDWNPTMDAQAQDRCHRIGQTRDVHIYRLISDKTVEENILKKANQKRILGDLAIEGGNFTTAFFKKNTIHELFGIETMEDISKVSQELKKVDDASEVENDEKFSPSQLEQALGMAEEESDLQAAKTAHAEAAAELAEFDESIPLDTDSREVEEKSPAEEELEKLMDQLTPVEKYAVQFLESLQEPVSLEQLKLAEEEIEAQKKDWELGHLKALKEEEERRASRLADEEALLFCGHEAPNQVYFSVNGQEEMPMWSPPTPPANENDLYIDHTVSFWYDSSVMHEARLPPIFIKKEAKRLRVDPVVSAVATTRKQKVRKDDIISIPRSLFDRPTAAILKMRREVKLQKVKGLMVGAASITKPVASFPGLKQPPLVVNKPVVDIHQEKPEWLVREDMMILQILQEVQCVPLNLTILMPGQIPNWDIISDNVSSIWSYRSPKVCKSRFENVILPREEGKILYDMNPKKQKKTKGIYKSKNNRPMKTNQLFVQDNNVSYTATFNAKFKMCLEQAAKRKSFERPTFLQTNKNPQKLATVLTENGIDYDHPLTAMQIASNRAERIAREKQKNQPVVVAQAIQGECTAQVTAQALAQATEQQLAAQRQVQQQTTIAVAGATNIIPPHQAQAVIASLAQAQQLQQVQLSKANLPQGAVTSVSLAKSLTSGIMVNATPGSASAGTFATISKALTQAGVTSISSAGAAQNAAIAAALTNANLRNQRATVTAVGTTASMTVQEMVAAAAAAGQVRGLTTTSGGTSTAPAVVSVAGLTAVQLATSQRITGSLSAATTVASSAVNPLSSQVTTQRNISQLTQFQAIRQTALIRQREQQNLKQQQHLKRLQTVQQQQASQQAAKVAVSTGGTLTVTAAQQRVGQQQVPLKQSVGRQMTEAEMAQLMKRQQLQQQKQAQLTTAQILAQAHLQQVQPQQVSITGGTATLVKTVSAPLSGTSSVAIPVSAVTMGGVNINVSLPQGKTSITQGKGATTITNQQLRQFQIQQQLLNQARKSSKVSANLTQLAKVPSKGAGITATSLSAPMNAVQIVQHNAQVGTTQQVKGLPAAMTVQQIQQAMKAIPQNLPVVVTATPSLPGVQQQHTSTTLRGEPGVATGSVKAQTTTLPSTTLTTSGVLKGTPAVVVGQQQTAAILQQVAASTSGLTPQQAVTLAVRAAASQAQGQQQVQIQVQQSPHSSLVSPQSQVVSATLQSGQTRMQQLSQSTSTISIAQPVSVQSTAQASSILSSAGTIVPQMAAESTHVVMHSVSTSSSGTALSIPASLATSQTASTTAQVVQAAIQAARQQQQQAAQQAAQQQKASPYTMRLRNPPK